MIIKCEERYQEAMDHAAKIGDKTLQDCLERLKQWEANQNCEIFLCKDFAPLSFYFVMNDKNGNRVMNGGVLYHGNPDKSYAVTFDPTKGWQIHT
ncbi:hypothetical protein HMPREF1212_01288 [Parabacteroides sp. HGS0025]|uniref:DUF4120 family protein n=1 Tax=Parabacteroides sp. HGS0025 TaxID=1078087 RepID=UPI000616EB59|nr:DUF4120 family protein [Parabacteroides sp. HGS0025]KKB53125.1 hypothetical protein HMPREF1212_01288 [Parabacteroides sp. HGS0025]